MTKEATERIIFRALRDKVAIGPETPLKKLFPIGSIQHTSAVDWLCDHFGKEKLSEEMICSQRTVGDVLKCFTNGSVVKEEGAQEEILSEAN